MIKKQIKKKDGTGNGNKPKTCPKTKKMHQGINKKELAVILDIAMIDNANLNDEIYNLTDYCVDLEKQLKRSSAREERIASKFYSHLISLKEVSNWYIIVPIAMTFVLGFLFGELI